TEELAGALARLLSEPDRRAAMGAAGRARVLQLYSWASVARSTADCYAAAVAEWRDARC
ncbi:MAG: glycosyltransferase family protein, partial [Nocardioidaceae bacterium]